MGIDLLIPFGILLVLVVYLIYTRTTFEKDILKTYEEKFENWKSHHSNDEVQKESKRELVGLIFKKDGKIDMELFDEYSNSLVERKKFTSKIKK